jgi:hypothetical protein
MRNPYNPEDAEDKLMPAVSMSAMSDATAPIAPGYTLPGTLGHGTLLTKAPPSYTHTPKKINPNKKAKGTTYDANHHSASPRY